MSNRISDRPKRGLAASQQYMVVNTPAPSALLLLALGLVGLGIWWRRQRDAAALAA